MRISLSGLLVPVRRERPLGYADVRKVFSISGVGTIAGCIVTEGIVRRGAGARLLRGAVIIHDGKIRTLRRFKDDASEVKAGYECGIALAANDDIRVGDRIVCYAVEEIGRSLPPIA